MRYWGLALVLLGALVFGGLADLRARPPDMGSPCHFVEVEERARRPERGEPPPAMQSPPVGDGAEIESASGFSDEGLSMLAWDALSPRLGVGLTSASNPEVWARRLGAGWYLDWRVLPRYPEQKPQHWQMIRLGRGCIYPRPEAVAWLAARYTGNVWIIGNEPDNPWQDNVTPEEYAQVYHRLYTIIKSADPHASVAVAGVTQATPLRLAYLDRVLSAYQALYGEPLPADWWTLHGFVLREERDNWGAGIPAGFPHLSQGRLYSFADGIRVDHFVRQVWDFRAWMARNGYRHTPLALTEFGILAPSDAYSSQEVADYLQATFSWLASATDPQIGLPADGNRLVQRWAWFSLYDPLYPASNLGNLPADGLTLAGWTFRRFALTLGR